MDQHHTPHTDETQLDAPTAALPAALPTALPTRDTVVRVHRRARRLVAVAVLGSLAVGIAGAVALGGGSGATAPAAAGPAGSRGAVGLAAERPTVTVPPTTAPASPADLATPPVDGTPQPPAPPEAPAEPGILAVSTNAIQLPAGVFSGSFTVRNDGGSPVDWHWKPGDFGISVDIAGGTLAAGESVVVTFTINPFQQPVGEFLFANCVYNDEVAKDVWIHGEKKPFVVNPDLKNDLPLQTQK